MIIKHNPKPRSKKQQPEPPKVEIEKEEEILPIEEEKPWLKRYFED